MLSVYDLYDLHSIFVAIRSQPENQINYEIISNVIDVLNSRFENYGLNQFRKKLRSINSINNSDIFNFINIDNCYSYYPLPFLVDERIYILLVSSCKELLTAILEGNYDRVYDLADCLHDLPIILTENCYSVPKKYWKTFVDYYRKKWNRDFLLVEQKNL